MNLLAEQALFLSDRRRMRGYAEAIRRTVRPGDRVVDLGCGTGILGFLALRAGAAHVTAIERGPSIHLARRLARANGLDDRIRFVHADSSDATVHPRADVLVSETLWHLGVGEGLLESAADAVRRLLRGGARLIPRRLTIWFQPISCPAAYRRAAGPGSVCGLSFEPMRLALAQQPSLLAQRSGRPLAAARPLLRFDLARIGRRPFPAEGAAAFTAARAGTLHGWAGWFEAELAPGVRLVSRRGTHWRRVLLPVSPPRAVRRGERLRLEVRLTGEREIHWIGRAGRGRFAHSTMLGGALLQ